MEKKFYCAVCGYETDDSVHYCPICNRDMIYRYEDKYIVCEKCSTMFVYPTEKQLKQLEKKGYIELPAICENCIKK